VDDPLGHQTRKSRQIITEKKMKKLVSHVVEAVGVEEMALVDMKW
jgi:uncharacterized protein YjcR